MASRALEPSALVGRTLGHYRVVEKIGAGGMGEVYRARDLRLERDVALKILPPGTLADESARKRFRKEALALSKLNHPPTSPPSSISIPRREQTFWSRS